jgi:imidazolonepropionase-like amidohydrolase
VLGAGSAGGEGQKSRDPVFINATDYDQIVAAVAFAKRRGLKPVIVGGRDAPMCAQMLKEAGAAVIVQGPFAMPRRDDSPIDDAYTIAKKLEEAGVLWCMSSSEETAHERNLPYAAALAVAYGLDKDAALRGVTLNTAKILGIEASLGSIETSKSATFLVTDGNPLEITTKITHAFIDGREIDLSNKQTELDKKYRERYRQLKDK